MLFQSRESVEFELSILGYEYPDKSRNDDSSYDADWLNIRARLLTPFGGWTAVRPTVLTWEIERLATWFRDLAEARSVQHKFEFLQPYLRFEALIQDQDYITLQMQYEGTSQIPGRTTVSLWGDIQISPAELRIAALALEQELRSFPSRGTRPEWANSNKPNSPCVT